MKRNTNKYILKDKSGKYLYVGITNDLKRREGEHLNDGMKFHKIVKVGNKTTTSAAGKWEEETIKRYKANQGHLPKYNKNVTGK